MEKRSSSDPKPFVLPAFEEPKVLSGEDLKELAWKEGFEEGYAEGLRKAKEDVEKVLSRLRKVLSDLEGIRQRILAQCERDLLELSLEIAKKVIRRELEIDKSGLLELVRESIRKVTEADLIKVHLSPEDFEYIRTHKADVLREFNGTAKLLLYPDPKVEPGGCFVETDFAEVDARLSTQLEEIFKALRDEA